MKWYAFDPCDTLFFKGAEPMEAGENHYAKTLFPPPANVLQGAIRTAWLVQNKVAFSDYSRDKSPAVVQAIGEPGKPAPFTVAGPLLMREEITLAPMPAHWFFPKESIPEHAPAVPGGEVRVIRAAPPEAKVSEALGIRTNAGRLPWICEGEDAERPESAWVALDALASDSFIPGRDLFRSSWLFAVEPHTGIALERTGEGSMMRTAKDGNLYTAQHVRLAPGTRILFGLDREIGLADNGVLTLGGEQRIGQYRCMNNVKLPGNDGPKWLALGAVEATAESTTALFASGKMHYLGGWDFVRFFHKPMVACYPCGAVFLRKINETMIPVN